MKGGGLGGVISSVIGVTLTPVYANDINEADSILQSEDEIIVSSDLIVRPASEIINGVSVLNRDTMVKSLTPSLGSSLDKLPGVASTAFGQAASRPVLRGLGADRVLVLTSGVGVIDASAASPDHQVGADGIDAERIEIIRGPAALAYGGQAIGGVVNVIDGLIVSSLPRDQLSVDGFIAGNPERGDSEGALKGRAVLGEEWVLTGTVSRRDFGDYNIPGSAESLRQLIADGEEVDSDALGRVENSFVQTDTQSLGLSYVSDKGHIGFAARRQGAEYGIPLHSDEEDEGESAEEEEGAPFIDLDQTRYDVGWGYNLNQGPFTRISGVGSYADYTHTEFEGNGEAGTVFDVTGYETRIQGAHSVAGFEGVIGIQLSDRDLDARGEEAFLSATSSSTQAVFLYEIYEIDDKRGVEGGLRFDRTARDNAIEDNRTFDTVSASLGGYGQAHFGSFWGVKLSYSERAPSETELFSQGAHLATQQFEVGDPGLEKERGLGVEASWRWKGELVSLGVNLFATDFEDFIYLSPGVAQDEAGVLRDEIEGLPVFTVMQEGADFFGGEISAELTDPISFAGVDVTARGTIDFVEARLSQGGAVPLIPPVTLNAAIGAQWRGIELTLEGTIAGTQNDNGPGQLPTDGFEKFDVAVEWQLPAAPEGTRLFFQVNNLTDEEVRQATSTIKDVAPDPGRTFRTGLRVSF